MMMIIIIIIITEELAAFVNKLSVATSCSELALTTQRRS